MNFLFNPYKKIAGAKSLIIGFGFALVTLIIAPISHAAFDGVLDFHRTHFENYWVYAALYFISWVIIVLVFGLAGLLFSKSQFRWIDILGTTLLAKAPLLIVSIISFYSLEIQSEDINNILSLLTLTNIIAAIIIILCTIWMVALLFNAYSVSLHIKGGKLVWSFILILVLSEIFSKVIIYYLSPFLK